MKFKQFPEEPHQGIVRSMAKVNGMRTVLLDNLKYVRKFSIAYLSHTLGRVIIKVTVKLLR